MSWLYSRALVEEFSAAICLDGEPSAPLNGNPTPQAFCAPDKMTAFSRLSRFGMTYKPLTADRGEALLMSYLAAFHAKTSAQRGGVKESTVSVPACGNTWPASSVKYCLDSSLWKTAHCLWDEVLPWSSVTLPRWGMTRNGFVYQHPTLERPINGIDSGWLVPTPCAIDAGTGRFNTSIGSDKPRPTLAMMARKSLWPTPTCQDNIQQAGQFTKKTGTTLGFAARHWPTPQASDNRDRGNLSTPAIQRRMEKGKQVMLSMCVSSENGQLNPTWVEWLMGWPLGWTDLKPLAMDKFQEWQQQHSPLYQMSEAA